MSSQFSWVLEEEEKKSGNEVEHNKRKRRCRREDVDKSRRMMAEARKYSVDK